jgi:hypothetical protein
VLIEVLNCPDSHDLTGLDGTSVRRNPQLMGLNRTGRDGTDASGLLIRTQSAKRRRIWYGELSRRWEPKRLPLPRSREMPSQANVETDAVFDSLPPDCEVPVDDQLVVDLACMFGDVSPLVWMSGRGIDVEVPGGDGAQLGRAGDFV